MLSNDLSWFMLSLVVTNIAMVLYLTHIIAYHLESLSFLKYVNEIMVENGDEKESDKLIKNDIPLYVESTLITRGMLYFVISILNLDILLFIIPWFSLFQTTMIWDILIWVSVLSNSFIIITINYFRKLKIYINATCEANNVLIQSYEYLKESEDNNNNERLNKF